MYLPCVSCVSAHFEPDFAPLDVDIESLQSGVHNSLRLPENMSMGVCVRAHAECLRKCFKNVFFFKFYLHMADTAVNCNFCLHPEWRPYTNLCTGTCAYGNQLWWSISCVSYFVSNPQIRCQVRIGVGEGRGGWSGEWDETGSAHPPKLPIRFFFCFVFCCMFKKSTPINPDYRPESGDCKVRNGHCGVEGWC